MLVSVLLDGFAEPEQRCNDCLAARVGLRSRIGGARIAMAIGFAARACAAVLCTPCQHLPLQRRVPE